MSASNDCRWTKPADIKARLMTRWERGTFLSNSVESQALFPFRIPIRGPASGEISADFSAVREWITNWRAQSGVPCEWKAFTHRLFGANELPNAAVFPDAKSVVRLLGVSREWEAFHKIVENTRSAFPELLPWLALRPMQALELASDWELLLAVITWVREHPRSNFFIRQIDIPGVHTKFVELHRGTLGELLDLVLLREIIDADARGSLCFNRRYGFQDKPERIRIRFLDPSCTVEHTRFGLDITLNASAFANLAPSITRVFITENEINFLTFPEYPKSLVIFGAGYGWSALDGVNWLNCCEVHYWGDIDTHGFAILDQLRSHVPHAQSFLMDLDTFVAFGHLCSSEPNPLRRDLNRLNPEEQTVYDTLRNQADRKAPRLEQERIPFSTVQAALRKLDAAQLLE